MLAISLYGTLLVLSSLPIIFAAFDLNCSSPCEVVQKDIVIVGGGAAGSHAAVRLREDYNKSVIVIEQEPILVSNLSCISS
jgi:heterodisulfide reductase subunit A-like polyferredoxin